MNGCLRAGRCCQWGCCRFEQLPTKVGSIEVLMSEPWEGCSGEMLWRIHHQVRWGLVVIFAPAVDMFEHSSFLPLFGGFWFVFCFVFWKCTIAFELGCCMCLWVSYLQFFSWQLVILVSFRLLSLGNGCLCSGRDWTIAHPFAPSSLGLSHQLGTLKGTPNSKPTFLHPHSFPLQGMVMIFTLL